MVKNFLYTVSILLIMTTSLYAQDESETLYTRAGFKAGLNYTNVIGDIEDTDARVRMHLGAVIEFPVSQRFFIQTEVLYSAQGYKVDVNGEENKISLNYLTLPIIAKFYFTNKFSLEIGPQFALLANATESKGDTPDEFFDSFNNFDFSGGFGAGYKTESGLFFQFRYNLGLTNINDIDTLDVDFKHSVAQLSVGYLFRTKNNRRQNSNNE
ncbi:outer membrane protein with beta-barrel domain [Aquimarina sp. MAR_2010_214]|uniref:porin family protein n=1 Tax=Aquimarina sp. MAR_2010_214 TaxID=1250026 RepID=UPI000C6FF3CA|nr:porin family protein [Aquimarina sp. MAR_2010_214]PKV51225.1 outer membrane protein with beta-barrel domain [Aquimarina sp. MAR_2010_214]